MIGLGPGDWLAALAEARAGGEPAVLVTVIAAEGSTPRAAGTKMAVFADRFAGTIGGGALEHRALDRARQLLAEGPGSPRVEEFPLGPALGQCCGGHTTLLFEPFLQDLPLVLLFGAGHVGHAIVGVLADLPLRVRWYDTRPGLFPAALPPNVVAELSEPLEAEVAAAPPGAVCLVMTHSHALDYALVAEALRRGDFAHVGMIGSATKRARCERHLRDRGLDPAALTCPIGLPGIGGKHPKEIAVAVAAQVLQIVGEPASADDRPPSPTG